MTNSLSAVFKRCSTTLLLTLLLLPHIVRAQPSQSAISYFENYTQRLESRIAQQHRSPSGFLAQTSQPQAAERERRGEVIIDALTPSADEIGGAMLHHWRGTAFVSGAHAADFERLLKDAGTYPRYFASQVQRANVLARHGDTMQMQMRVRQKHVITVVMDIAYNVSFGQLDAQHRYSISRSTRISEIDHPGTPQEHALSAADEHGFLWRMNTYWSYEERDGGLYLQIESVSLTRSIPTGLGWVMRPFVETVPRESLEFTLRSAVNAMRK